uniref:4Fe-4S ferredoxin-type domain-containing protein n=1 Tax=candidate division WOR-3 bacterium TaxID=2052148 RepID=A0A7C4YF69_UNCW3
MKEYCKNILRVNSNCSRCLLCSSVCPNGTIIIMNEEIKFKKDSLFCGLCLSLCPEEAIEKI